METRKVCRVLIIIFILLSIFFNYLYVSELKKRTVISDELVADVVRNLASYGIEVSEDNIEKNMPERDIYYFELNDKNEYFSKITSSICNSLFISDIETTEFDTPDGHSVGFYEKNNYNKELGRVLFSESDLSFVFSKNGISMKHGDKPIENMQTDEIDESKLNLIQNVISELSSSWKSGYRITGSSSNNTFLIVTVMQTIADNDICDAFINFVFQDNELVILSGKWITEQTKAKYHNKLLDGVNVLYKLNLDEVKSIDEQRVVYSLRKTEDNRYFVIPCWQIKFTDKHENFVVSYFDAL